MFPKKVTRFVFIEDESLNKRNATTIHAEHKRRPSRKKRIVVLLIRVSTRLRKYQDETPSSVVEKWQTHPAFAIRSGCFLSSMQNLTFPNFPLQPHSSAP